GLDGRRGGRGGVVQPEEADRLRGVDRQVVRHALHADGLDRRLRSAGAVAGAGVAGLRAVGVGRLLAPAVDVGPLLDLFVEVRVAQRLVVRAVPQLHPWPRAVVSGVGVADRVAPLLGAADDLAVGALAVPGGAAGGGEAGERHTGEGRPGPEDV